MTKDRFKLRASVYMLLIKDGKIFLLRRFNTGWSDGLYSLPAGHVDGQEPLRQAACREAREEAGVNVRPDNLEFAHVMHRYDADGDKKEYLDFFFAAKQWDAEPYNAEPEKCDDAGWYPLENLPKNLLPYVRQTIEDYKDGKHFSEVGW